MKTKSKEKCGQKIYDRNNKEMCGQEIIDRENYSQQRESERVKNESEDQRIVGLADTRQRESENFKNDIKGQRNVRLGDN